MKKFGPSFLISVLLHAGLLALALFSWVRTEKLVTPASVPVEIVSQIPSRQQAEAPVDQNAVLPPAPIPAPEEQPKPTPPTPEPAPPLPVPAPQKAVTPAPKPTPKPTPAPAPKPAPPDKNGLQKPVPPKPAKPEKPALDLNALAQLAAAPSKSPTRQQARANTHRTTGASIVGAGPADAGKQSDLAALYGDIHYTINNCDVPGVRDVKPEIKFKLSSNGRVIEGPVWLNRRNDPLWQTGAALAIAAINKGQPYSDLPSGLYNIDISLTFDQDKVCP